MSNELQSVFDHQGFEPSPRGTFEVSPVVHRGRITPHRLLLLADNGLKKKFYIIRRSETSQSIYQKTVMITRRGFLFYPKQRKD